MAIEVRPAEESDRSTIVSIAGEAFNNPAGMIEQLQKTLPLEGRWVALDEGRPRAMCRVMRQRQYFGGRPVPAMALAAVAVDPEARSRGVGSALLRGVHAEVRREGVVLATLYPSTMAPYRKFGYELAGGRTRYIADLASVPSSKEATIERWNDDSLDEVKDCYLQFAARHNGPMDRSEWFWEKLILAPPEERPLYSYLVRHDGRVTGYVVFEQFPEQYSLPVVYVPEDENYRLACRDLVWLDLASARSILSFAHGHRGFGSYLSWTGPENEPLGTLFHERVLKIESSYQWMSRILDVPGAIEARGYARGAEAGLDLKVTDSVLGDSICRIDVSDGHAKVGSIANARATVDVGALSAMYTGWLQPRDAAALGRLAGASDGDIEALEAMFAGPLPWMPDFF